MLVFKKLIALFVGLLLASAAFGNRLHMVSGDVQSAGTGVHVHTDSHDAYEFGGARK